MQDLIGRTLGHYRITDKIGSGGMGQVYRAKDHKLGRDVAIKVLRDELATDPERLRRFEQEARSASALNHPNIITIHDIGKHDSTPYIAMEFVEGKTLREMLADGPLPTKKLLQLATQIAEGLAKAHSAGIVHRDLKPENLMVTSDGYVKILDFGLAKLRPQTSDTESDVVTETKEGTILGTVGYMSPDQAKGQSADHRSDQFSLGAILYEMATGQRAFQRDSSVQTLSAVIEYQPEPISALNPCMPSRLGVIVGRCLEKSPEDRYDSTRDLSRELRSVLEELPRSTAPSSATPMIAVLPFTNLSSDADDEYFSDGMTEDIIAQLSQIGSLRVISRTSAMRYKNSELSVKEIAAALGASHIVEGSVRRAADQLRIVAQLIDASSDAHLWAETFDREMTDVFAVQSEVAERIAGALQARLTPDEQQRFGRRPTDDQEAYNLYLLARHHFNQATTEGFGTAIELYQQAVARDPKFARAWASIAVAHHWHVCGYYGIRPRDAAAVVVEHASRALQLDPDIAEAHMMLGEVELWTHHNWEGSRLRHERALALSPNLAYAHLLYGNHLMSVGRPMEAVEVAQRALELDPAAEIAHVHANFFRYSARQYDQALAGLEAAEALFGRRVLPLTRGETLIALGRAAEAIESFRELYARIPVGFNQIHLAWGLAAAGEETEAREVLTDVHERETQEYVWHMGIATAYAHLGEMDRAFEHLERSYEEREAWTMWTFAPTFDPFRSDPRFDAIVQRIGAPAPVT